MSASLEDVQWAASLVGGSWLLVPHPLMVRTTVSPHAQHLLVKLDAWAMMPLPYPYFPCSHQPKEQLIGDAGEVVRDWRGMAGVGWCLSLLLPLLLLMVLLVPTCSCAPGRSKAAWRE